MAVKQRSSFEWSFKWDNLQKKLKELKVDIDDAGEEGFNNIGKAAVREIQKLIEIRGDPLTPWSGIRYYQRGQGNSAGRNDTGRMKESVDYEVNGSELIFGWIYDQENYFLYQEYGTARIAPMFALRDAATLANQIGPGLVAAAVSNAIRKAGF